MQKYVFYHAQCPDGFGAAWAIWQSWGDSAVYFPVSHGNPLPDIGIGAEILMVDFCYDNQNLIQLALKAKKITIIDHHQTAYNSFLSFPITQYPHVEAHFDMNHSGAVLTWQYLYPDKPVPELLQYIEDKDIWRFQLPKSKEFSAGLRVYDMDFGIWQKINVKEVIQEGEILLRYQQKLVNKLCENVRFEKILNHEVPVVNSPTLQSEIGNYLCTLYPENAFAVVYFDNENKRNFSLRSVGEFDVSVICKHFGGGGHRNASGFAVKLGELGIKN